jgi:hypothetical protein
VARPADRLVDRLRRKPMMSSFSMPWMRSRVVDRGRHRDCEALCIAVWFAGSNRHHLENLFFSGRRLDHVRPVR